LRRSAAVRSEVHGEEFARDVALALDMLAATEH
jgi:hypothetical protein